MVDVPLSDTTANKVDVRVEVIGMAADSNESSAVCSRAGISGKFCVSNMDGVSQPNSENNL